MLEAMDLPKILKRYRRKFDRQHVFTWGRTKSRPCRLGANFRLPIVLPGTQKTIVFLYEHKNRYHFVKSRKLRMQTRFHVVEGKFTDIWSVNNSEFELWGQCTYAILSNRRGVTFTRIVSYRYRMYRCVDLARNLQEETQASQDCD